MLRGVTAVLVVSVAASCANPSKDVVNFGTHEVADVNRAIASVIRATERPTGARPVQNACARLEYVANSTLLRFASEGDLAQALVAVKEAGGYCESVLFTKFPEAVPEIRFEMVELRDRLQQAFEAERRRIRDRVQRATEEKRHNR